MTNNPDYRGYRLPSAIVARAVWLYHRSTQTLRDVEDLLAERGITVSYETIRQWCHTFGTDYARKIHKRLRPSSARCAQNRVMRESALQTCSQVTCTH